MKRIVVCSISLAALFTSCGGDKDNKPEAASLNPFLSTYTTPFQVPPFEQIKLEHYMPAFEAGFVKQQEEVDAIINNTEEPSFQNTIEALALSGEILENVSAVFYNLLSANTNAEMQKLAEDISPISSKHRDDIILNADLFKRVKAVYDNKDNAGLNFEQIRLVEETYKDFVRGGAMLSDNDKNKLRAINEELSLLSLQYGNNVLAENNEFRLWIDNESDLEGLPQSVREAAATSAKNNGQEGKWLFTLHFPSYTPFMTYSAKRDLREKMFKAYSMRGNNGGERDNNGHVTKMVNLRRQKAELLGYETFAHFVLDENMAGKPENVYNLLAKVWEPAKKRAIEEVAEMQKIIASEGNSFQLAPWDWFYYAEKVRKKKYDLDDQMIRPYFELEAVQEGVFWVSNKLFGITFEEIKSIPLYHPDAKAYEVKEADGSHLGVLYVDYHPRESKRGGAWCTSYRSQKMKDGKRIAPVASVVCNFTPPSGDTPALLSYEEVETLFHEFGHALHVLFTNIQYAKLSSVPRDFVELPSQVLEHWAGQPEVLKEYAHHYKTGEVIPEELIVKINKSRQFNQGFATVEFVAASYLDMDYHLIKEDKKIDPNQFEKQRMDALGLISQIIPRYKSTYFNHIFAGGYYAGYYSYLWAEVLDADAFDAFKETGNIFNPEKANSFRRNILETGGTVKAMDMYVKFRGKEPGVEPMLRNRGLL